MVKKILKVIGLLVLLALLYVVGMIGFAYFTDYKPALTSSPTINGKASAETIDDTLHIISWNIGYCGLGKESDFFYDGGSMVRMPKATVTKNLQGVLDFVNEQEAETDFFLLQEVDKKSRRSWKIDEVAKISAELPGFAQAYGKNYDVGFIPIPFTNPMGTVNGGVSSWSKYQPTEATRYSFEGNYTFPTYLFFLDRCFLLERFPLSNGKDLIMINTHNSAYDDGTLKARQMEQMRKVLLEEYQKGNYVIVGGDWNQLPAGYSEMKGLRDLNKRGKIEVAQAYPEENWTWGWDAAVNTNRSLKTAFDPKTSKVQIIDYFLLSPNVEMLDVRTVEQEFNYSDHQPVKATVRLKGLNTEQVTQ